MLLATAAQGFATGKCKAAVRDLGQPALMSKLAHYTIGILHTNRSMRSGTRLWFRCLHSEYVTCFPSTRFVESDVFAVVKASGIIPTLAGRSEVPEGGGRQ